ncbi:MAG: phosphomannomutase/phosphoglucomutase [Candidatus Magasanikbacteria bacterium]|nr:phosphomannomutase/phosphoglucomutase [Candidatus Magasanikbacteria bacterium]
MKIAEHIFKTYDIRGLYPEELNEDVAYRTGRAFAELIKKEIPRSDITVAVGQDMRISSPSLFEAVVKGITDQGLSVVDIGLVSTPTFYFGVSFYGYDAGLQVSASHNPGKYNGFKMTRANAVPISGDTGILEIRDMVVKNEFPEVEKKGSVSKREGVLPEQIQFALTYVNKEQIKPFKIVVDTANGMGGPLVEELFKFLPCELIKMYFELDGNFPNHEADPLKDENNEALQKKVVEVGADFGVALDGDADRIFFIDNTGKTVEPAIVRGILAQIFLRDNPGAKICYDIRPGKITIDMITEAGGVPVVTRVGHSLIKEKMREIDSVFAGESSGHFFVKMPHGTFEVPEIITLKILEELSRSGQTMREYVQPLERYIHSGEINFAVTDKAAVFAKLKEKYGQNLQYDFDGLSFTWPDWWFNVRASNTENKMRLNLESTSEEVMKEKTKEVSEIIKS